MVDAALKTTASKSAKATLTNWRERPHSRWAFHNVDKLITSDRVETWPGQAVSLGRANGLLRRSLAADAFLSMTATDAVVVLADGDIVFEHYANGNDASTPHILMSASKSVMGLLLGLLEHRGALSLDAPVTDFVPEVAGTAYQGATLRQLLDMRAGVVLSEEQEQAYSAAAGWDPIPAGAAAGSLHAFLQKLDVKPRSHGGVFHYTSLNTDLLGWVVERATGASVASMISQLIWRPMGAERAGYLTVDRQGSPRCTGGLCATARDFARIGQLLVEGGRSGTTEVLPKTLVDDIARGGDPAAWRDGQWGKAFAPISKMMSYRSGWYIIDDDPKLIFAMGIHGQNLFIDIKNRIVIAKLSSWSKPTDYVALPLTHAAVGSVARAVRKLRSRENRI